MSMTSGQRSVCVFACEADERVASVVRDVARSEGLRVVAASTGDAPADLCIVLMSLSAVRDHEFLRIANAVSSNASVTIPVRLDEVRPEQAGEPGSPIRERNWADFSQSSGRDQEPWELLMRSNVDLYDDFYDLDERARRWELCDHDASYLLQDVKAAARAHEVLDALADDPYQRPNKVMRDYVEASTQHAAKERRRLGNRWVRTICAALFIVIAFVLSNVVLQYYQFHAELLRESMDGLDTNNDPEYAALRLLQIGANENVNSDTGFYQTIDALSSIWKISELGLAEAEAGTGAQGEAVFTDDGERVFVAGAEGTVQSWVPRTAEAADNRYVSARDRFTFDATPDGALLVVADEDGLRRFDTSTWERVDLGYDGPAIESVAVSADGMRALGATEDGIVLVDLDDGTVAAKLAADSTLAVERTPDGLRALVRTDSDVQFVDGESLNPLARATIPESADCVGAIGEIGAVIWSDGRLGLLAPSADELSPIAFSTKSRPLDLAISGKSVIVVTEEGGAQVVDVPTGATLARLGTSMAGVVFADATEAGLMSCGNGVTTSIYSLEGIAPGDEAPSGALVSESLECSTSDGTFAIRSDGAEKFVLTYGGKDHDYTFQGTHGERDDITAAACAYLPARYVIGTRSGGVTTYTMLQGEDGITMVSTREWDTPDGSSVEAVGWSEDGERLVVRAGGRWWTPYANSDAIGLQGIASTIKEREPAVWTKTEIESFPEDFVESMGMRVATPLPEPR
ncbi:WD40 repeat domain-containing protein [Olsenella sp. An270]|uniref:WD40 repeat domain-containing protein n=1 Tax=Olsenella sp. An270 TaxID=1965615 RepID=UPI000B371415|nr:WD40 repeat domain-containing protein [Olsenella sp. An270]OUO61021.1 hypothetical protein B5F73_01900 [Olsenella sp. An270]